MTCDKVWKNCFVKHLNIPSLWRNTDADKLTPERQDVFYTEVSGTEANLLAEFVDDIEHFNRIKEAAKGARLGVRGLIFILARKGQFVQYYPYFNFTHGNFSWETIKPIEFSDFCGLDDAFPKSRLPDFPGDM